MAVFKTILYKSTKNGGVSTYRIEIKHFRKHSEVHRYHATIMGGKEQCDITTIDAGVNLGKSNETTIVEQADRVANTIYNEYLDKGYKPGIPTEGQRLTNVDGLPKAMLAEKIADKHLEGGKKDLFAYYESVYLQPKLNGARCLAVFHPDWGEFGLITRNCKIWTTADHIKDAINDLNMRYALTLNPRNKLKGQWLILDGELYAHGMCFQDIISALKAQNEDSKKIRFHVYDIAVDGADQTERFRILNSLFEHIEQKEADDFPLVKVETIEVRRHKDVVSTFKRFRKQGFEGLMVRLPDAVYEFGHRSNGLLKYKEMVDEEFEIVGVKEASGRDKGTAVFIVNNPKGLKDHTFDVRPEGDHALRSAYFKDRKKLIGKLLTVRYQELSKDLVPIFPVGVTIRDYE